MRFLLGDARVDPEGSDWTGRTAISSAAEECHGRVVELLLRDPRVDPASADHEGLTPFLCAAGAREDNAEVIRLLLADSRANPSQADMEGFTAIILAADAGNAANLKVLIDAGLDVNAQNLDGLAALFYAVTQQSPDALRLLLESPNIDPNMHSRYGRPYAPDICRWALRRRFVPSATH